VDKHYPLLLAAEQQKVIAAGQLLAAQEAAAVRSSSPFRDAASDARRTSLAHAELSHALADPIVQAQRLIFARKAARSYWAWVAAERRLEIGRHLLEVAEKRSGALQKQVDAHTIRPVEAADNQRAIGDRRVRLLGLQRRCEQTAIELSLFYRDDRGQPVLADLHNTAPAFPEPQPATSEKLKDDIELALWQRPELRRLQLQRRQAESEVRQAENQASGVGVMVAAAQNASQGRISLQNGDVRGKLQSAQGSLAQISAHERYERDLIAAEVTDTLSALGRAHDMVRQARDNVTLARRLAAQERKAFPEHSNQLQVNFREVAQADAELIEVDAFCDFFQAFADYRAALGFDVSKPTGSFNRGTP
jgi:hypothetical protein